MEVLDIPASAVGKLIGKAGETIRNLQLSTDTRIQVGAPVLPAPDMEAAFSLGGVPRGPSHMRQPSGVTSAADLPCAAWTWCLAASLACIGFSPGFPCCVLHAFLPAQVDHAGEGDTKRVTITGMSA